MMKYINQFVNSSNKTGIGLVFWAVLLVFALIILQNTGVLPMRLSDFAFFSLITLALALYRPSWAFLFFVSLIALENINLAPGKIGIAVRPYQLLGAFVLISVFVRFFSKKLAFKLIKPVIWDWALLGMVAFGFLSALISSERGASLKLSVISLSFLALYFLARNYVQDRIDLKKTIPFFFGSTVIVVAYGIWQNIRSVQGFSSFEVMPGRPNSAFLEPDWLGMFLVFVLTAVYALIYLYQKDINFDMSSSGERSENRGSRIIKSMVMIKSKLDRKNNPDNLILDSRLRGNDKKFKSIELLLYIFLILVFALLIITVSRSAWLGAIMVTFVFLSVSFVRVMRGEWKFWEFACMKIGVVFSAVLALAFVFAFHLTDFQLFNRVQSTGTGLQKITVSCDDQQRLGSLKNPITDISELENTGCAHINLEDIEKEKNQGHAVGEISRQDPNVNIRAEIYSKSWKEIKDHPIFGIGWGSIGRALGTDERGAALNSSNIFLEVWLGSGIVGLLTFVSVLGFIIFGATRMFFKNKDVWTQAIGIFLITSWFAIVIPNLFNAGMMLAYLWVWMGISISLIISEGAVMKKEYENRN